MYSLWRVCHTAQFIEEYTQVAIPNLIKRNCFHSCHSIDLSDKMWPDGCKQSHSESIKCELKQYNRHDAFIWLELSPSIKFIYFKIYFFSLAINMSHTHHLATAVIFNKIPFWRHIPLSKFISCHIADDNAHNAQRSPSTSLSHSTLVQIKMQRKSRKSTENDVEWYWWRALSHQAVKAFSARIYRFMVVNWYPWLLHQTKCTFTFKFSRENILNMRSVSNNNIVKRQWRAFSRAKSNVCCTAHITYIHQRTYNTCNQFA